MKAQGKMKFSGASARRYGGVLGGAALFAAGAWALVLFGAASPAIAADVGLGGEMDIRSRYFSELDLTKNDNGADNHQAYTQERIILDVNIKADEAKGKISLWNDFDTWGRFETPQGNQNPDTASEWSPYLAQTGGTSAGYITIREAWMDFMLPGIPVGVKAGHQLIQLGQGWFFRSNYAGSDAWVVYAPSGDNLYSVIDTKGFEGAVGSANDDVDFYTALGSFKLADKLQGGIDVTEIADRAGRLAGAYTKILTGVTAPANARGMTLTNLGLNLSGEAGPANVKGEIDVQQGTWKNGASGGTDDMKFSGNQIVLQAAFPVEPVTYDVTLARGSGDKFDPASGTGTKYEGMVNLLDLTQHYTLLYEYKVKTAAGALNTGFANTTALSGGAMVKVAQSVDLGGDLWYFLATEKTNINPSTGGYGTGGLSNDVGTEVDLKANWLISPNLTWNWTGAYFTPGGVYKQANGAGRDAATGIQGYLTFKF